MLPKSFYKEVLLKLKVLSRGKNPQLIIKVALDILAPRFELRVKKVAAQKLRVPFYLSTKRAYALACRWICDSVRERVFSKKLTLAEKLALELFDAYNFKGYSLHKETTFI